MTFKKSFSYHFISLVTLGLCKGKVFFASGKTEDTVRKDTLHRMIHKVNLREKSGIYNLKLWRSEGIQTTFVFLPFTSYARPIHLTEEQREGQMKHSKDNTEKGPNCRYGCECLVRLKLRKKQETCTLICPSSGKRGRFAYYGVTSVIQERNTRWIFHFNSMIPNPSYLK